MAKYSTIGVKATTKEKLLKMFKPRETWDELIERLIEEASRAEQAESSESNSEGGEA